MILNKTVVILGAGSSPYGFPSGFQLMENITRNFGYRIESELFQFLSKVGITYQEYVPFRDDLKFSGQNSVDAFLEYRKEYLEVGKKAIAAALIPFENISNCFYCSPSIGEDHQPWFNYLFSKMKTNFEDFGKNNVVFITFNYDRSLEYYLFTSLKNTYGQPVEKVIDVLQKIPIIHFHGQLGKPHFIDPTGRDYSPELNPEVVKKSAKEIYIVHEDVEHRTETIEARRNISESKRVIFLGFGWNEDNLRRLGFQETGKDKRIEGTALGKTPTEMGIIKQRFKSGLLNFVPEHRGNLKYLRNSTIFD